MVLPEALKRRGGAFALPALEPSVVKAAFGAVGELLVACGIGAAAARMKILDKVRPKGRGLGAFGYILVAS